jgi:hypothetical protein
VKNIQVFDGALNAVHDIFASSKATVSVSRRVLHFVFWPRLLPCAMEWPASVVAR